MCPHHELSPVMTTITSFRNQRQQRFQPGQQENYEGTLTRSMWVDSYDSPRGKVKIDGSNGNRDNITGISSCSDIINTPTSIIDEQRNAPIQPCEGCDQLEPISPTKYFIDAGDSNTGRCVCLACEKTMVATYDDIVPLWDKAKSKCFIMSLLIQKLTLDRDGSLDTNFLQYIKAHIRLSTSPRECWGWLPPWMAKTTILTSWAKVAATAAVVGVIKIWRRS